MYFGRFQVVYMFLMIENCQSVVEKSLLGNCVGCCRVVCNVFFLFTQFTVGYVYYIYRKEKSSHSKQQRQTSGKKNQYGGGFAV